MKLENHKWLLIFGLTLYTVIKTTSLIDYIWPKLVTRKGEMEFLASYGQLFSWIGKYISLSPSTTQLLEMVSLGLCCHSCVMFLHMAIGCLTDEKGCSKTGIGGLIFCLTGHFTCNAMFYYGKDIVLAPIYTVFHYLYCIALYAGTLLHYALTYGITVIFPCYVAWYICKCLFTRVSSTTENSSQPSANTEAA